MNKLAALALITSVTGSAFAQLSPLPPSSTTDGVSIQAIGLNSGATHWNNPWGLAAYQFASDANLGTPNMQSPDNVLGLNWASTAPASLLSARSELNSGGGTIRAIFLGESAGWANDFGYTYTGNPQGAGSYTAFENISGIAPGNTVSYGDYFDVQLAPGAAMTFDFWLNGVGDFGLNPSAPSTNGGVYTAFDPSHSTPLVGPGNVLWSQTPLLVSTWIPSLGTYLNVPTYLVGFEDWRRDRGSDNDNNDFLFAIQMFRPDGTPLGPVPEPSTYGLIGAGALLALTVARRIRKVDSKTTSA